MAHYNATIDSRRSARDTLDYLADFSNAAEWDPGTLTAEQLDPGPVRAGTRFRLIVPFLAGGSRSSTRSPCIRHPGRWSWMPRAVC